VARRQNGTAGLAFKRSAVRLRIRLCHANTRSELGFGGRCGPPASSRPRT
jgi:hypothetical protein